MATYDHWLNLHIGDYVGDTLHLSTLQHGIYLLLIIHYFRHRGLPDNEYELAQIARMRVDHWRRASPRVMKLFFHDKKAQRWRHKRIDEDLLRASNGKEKPTFPNGEFNIRGYYYGGTQSRNQGRSSTHARAGANPPNHKTESALRAESRTRANGQDRPGKPDRNAAFDVLREMQHETTKPAARTPNPRVVDFPRRSRRGKHEPH